MTSLTVPRPPDPSGSHNSVSREAMPARQSGVASLDPFLYQRMRWCTRCGGQQNFVDVFECEAGRLGCCLGCGEERVIPWSRATEVAA
jgi:hypothetical protein